MKSSILASALVGTTVAQNVFAGRRGGFLPGNSFPMNVVGEMSGVEVSEDSSFAPVSAFPMGSVQMPGSFSFVADNQWVQGDFGDFGAFDSAESVLVGSESTEWSTEGASAEGGLELPTGGIGFNSRRDRTEAVLDLISGHGPGPESQWKKYVSSFKVLPGAQEPASQIINRQLSSLHNWASSFYGSRFVQQNGRLGLGLERPRNFAYSDEPWVPPTPILSCPPGTPEFVCERIAESISSTIPRGESYANADLSEYFLNQNLIRAGYGGIGAPNRRVPLGRNKITGPAPEIGPAASSLNPNLLPKEDFNCVVEVTVGLPFNPPFRSADRVSREHELEIEYDLECVCTPQGLPQTDRCRMISANSPDSLDTSAFPMAMGIYGDRTICTSFDDFQAGNDGEVATPCETIVQMGVTVMPVTKLPGVQIPQPGYSGGYPGNRQSSYSCPVEVEVAMLMDSPMPWENNFETFEAFYIQTNELECQCDQYNNAIVSTCRMGMDNERNLEIGNNYGEYTQGGRYNTPAESSGLLADGIDKYPYTQGSYNPNVVDQTAFPGWGTGVPSNPNFQQGGFFPFRREGAEEEAVERQSALTLADYKDFVAQAVEQATEAAQLANEAAVRAANAAEQGDANAAKAEARQAATYAAMADIAAEKAARLSQQVNQKVKKAQRKNRKVQRKVEGAQ